MPPKMEPISVRTARLNNLILGKGAGVCAKPAGSASGSGIPASTRRSIVPVSTTSAAVAEAICREGLLDAFCLLYNECDKDTLKKRDRNIAEFVNKCESTALVSRVFGWTIYHSIEMELRSPIFTSLGLRIYFC